MLIPNSLTVSQLHAVSLSPPLRPCCILMCINHSASVYTNQNAHIHPNVSIHLSFILEDVQNIQCSLFIPAGLESRESNSMPKLIFFFSLFLPQFIYQQKKPVFTHVHICMSMCFPLTTHLRTALRSRASQFASF